MTYRGFWIPSAPVFVLLLASCEVAPATVTKAIVDITPRSDRASDGLLSNRTLQQVVDVQNARDVAGLKQYMSHEDPLVRARAAFGAASVQAPALIPTLIDHLDDPDPRVRSDVAFALGQVGEEAASGALSTALARETEVTAQRRMIEALGRIGDEQSLAQLIRADYPNNASEPLALALASYGARDVHDGAAIEWLAHQLSARDPQLRASAAYYFGRVPTSRPWALHAAYVRDALEDYKLDDPAAMHLVLGLGKFHGADGRLLLHRLRNATDWRVRVNTASALAPLSSDARVRDALIESLDDSNLHVATTAATSLDWSETLKREHLDHIERWIDDHPESQTVVAALLVVLANRGRGDLVLQTAGSVPPEDASALVTIIPAVGMVRSPTAFELLSAYVDAGEPLVRTAAITTLTERWARWHGAVDGEAPFTRVFSKLRDESEDKAVRLTAAYVLNEITEDLSPVEDIPDRQLAGTDWGFLATVGPKPRIHLHTTQGDITLELIAEQAPQTVQHFLQGVLAGSYNGVPFHRVLPNFAIQAAAAATDPRSPDIVSEFTRIPFRRGVIGMANSGKDTEDTEFFITHSMQPHLDGRFTAFGYVIEGAEVVDRIMPTDRIILATLEEINITS